MKDLKVNETTPGHWAVTDGDTADVHGRIVELFGGAYAWELHLAGGSAPGFLTGPAKSPTEALESIRAEWPTHLNDA